MGQDEKGLGKEEKFGRSCPEGWLSLGNQSSVEWEQGEGLHSGTRWKADLTSLSGLLHQAEEIPKKSVANGRSFMITASEGF